MQGSAPVINAQVEAVVTGPDGREATIQLLDNGLAGEDRLYRWPELGCNDMALIAVLH